MVDSDPFAPLPGAKAGSIASGSDVDADRATKIAAARAIWEAAGSIIGSPAEDYLRERRIDPLDLAPDIVRWHAAKRTMVVPAVGVDRRIVAIQRLYFDRDGAVATVTNKHGKQKKHRLSKGQIRGAALTIPGRTGEEIIIAGGAEKAMACYLATGAPCLGILGEGMMESAPLVARAPVVIMQDSDESGIGQTAAVKAAIALAKAGHKVRIARPPEGFDVNDVLERAKTVESGLQAIAALISAAEAFRLPEAARPLTDEGSEAPEKRPRTPEALVALAQHFKFWVSTDGEAFAEIREGQRARNVPISSETFKRILTIKAYGATHQLPSASAIDQAARYYAARAMLDGEKCKAWNRVGTRDGKVYIDLADQRGQVIEISAAGVQIISGGGLPFVASEMMQPLCEPVLDLDSDRPIDELRRFLNVEGDDDFALIVGWLVMALSGRGPYPILLIKAEHGSGKTWLASVLSSLVDPCKPSVFALPEKVRDLVAILQNRHGIFLDNVSFISAEASDAICVAAYGQGLLYRKLHTDSAVNVFDDARPIALNGIEDLARRHDLASRGLFIRLKPLADADRRPDDELERDWDDARPRILGALCYAVASVLRNTGKHRVLAAGRMAQFQKFAAAAEPGLGFAPGTFADAYARNQICAENVAFENDLVAVAVRDMMDADALDNWSGTPTRLLEKLDAMVSEKVRLSREWPRNAVSLGRHHDRCKKILRSKGIDWRSSKSGARTYTITRIKTA